MWKEIWNSYGNYYEEQCLLRCDTIWSSRNLPVFWRNLLQPFLEHNYLNLTIIRVRSCADHKYHTEWTNQTFYPKLGGSWFLWNVGIHLTILYQSLKTVIFRMHFCIYSGTVGTEIFYVIHCNSSLEKKSYMLIY